MGDFVYENPPLVEVIVEMHWELEKLPSLPGAIDPFFLEFVEKFRRAIKRKGFNVEEDVAPPGAPLEFFGDQVVKRFRRKPGGWPLYQIGPGVFAANIVPPYQGWENFKPIIRDGFDTFFKTHPGTKKSLKIIRLQLRYINAFDEEFGMIHPGQFIRDQLKLAIPIPSGLNKTKKKRDADVHQEGRLMMLLNEPPDAGGIISWKGGKKKNKPAVIMEIDIRTAKGRPPQKSLSMMAWLNKSHGIVHTWFHSVLSPEIRKKMGKRIRI